jgi:hypothetical protein
MTTLFDIVTVTSFLGLAVAFFLWTERDTRTLVHFSISGVALAVANQLGNAGVTVFALILMVAALGYALVMAWRPAS